MNSKKVYPVIHHLDYDTTIEQTRIAFECGADGVFLISHECDNEAVINAACILKEEHSDKEIGVNLLGWGIAESLRAVNERLNSINMIWFDECDIRDGSFSNRTGMLSSNRYIYPEIKIFASVAFKYQQEDSNPKASAALAELFNLIPVTSGVATGCAPNIDKIKNMSEGLIKGLGIASGMTVDNIEEFAPYLEYILVSTGVSKDFHTFDYEKLRTFIGKVRNI